MHRIRLPPNINNFYDMSKYHYLTLFICVHIIEYIPCCELMIAAKDGRMYLD